MTRSTDKVIEVEEIDADRTRYTVEVRGIIAVIVMNKHGEVVNISPGSSGQENKTALNVVRKYIAARDS